MIKAVIFDCFGVLCTDGWLPLKRQYFGHDKALFEQAGDLNKQVDAGMASYQDFIAEIADMAGITVVEVRRRIEANPPNEELFTTIRRIKADYKIGLLSNAGANWLPDIFSQDHLQLFDAVALSYETGASKPHVQAYQTIADRLGVSMDECVFIDDQPAFCDAAEANGMKAIVYRTPEQLNAELNDLLA